MGRIVIVGSGGRLGAALAREWAQESAQGGPREEVTGFTRRELDLGDDTALRAALEPLEFEVLVNCAALTNVDYCETHEAEAFAINAHAVGTLARICERKGARLIHISTDYVFDGEKREPYAEEDEPRPISVYGASKLAGERAALEVSERHLVARVSWVFGPDRPSFVDQILARARKEERVEAVADKWAVPTFTLDAAAMLQPLLRKIPEGGVLHVCNSGGCTWQEYGQWALDCAVQAGVELKARTVGALRMSDIAAFVARRPPFTVMSPKKVARLTGSEPRHWQQAVESYVRDFVAPGRPASSNG
jgi:dTDP-4-dehydrorhamnose reductase